ncbi:MAG: hypothetical protein JSR82_08760 [Verrucomicrobia bacterium]|nr:hypothetical protein [Verrucomicrobiota bacterium]
MADAETLPTRDLASLTKEDWDVYLGEVFRWDLPDGTSSELRLTDVRVPRGAQPFRTGGRMPYAISFTAPAGRVHPQSIYPLRHPVFGRAEVFIVPHKADANGVYYEAQFS